MLIRNPEYQFLDLLKRVLERGDRGIDQTGVETLSIFGAMTRFDLAAGAPILTTKRVDWKTAIKEMLWSLTGQTNIQPLLKENVRNWSDWPLARYRNEIGEDISKEDFEARIVEDDAFATRWGDLGPVYSRQWRRWQGPDGREYDQIGGVIDALRNNPSSRRIPFHGCNVAEIDQMALPRCNMVYQFHVSNGRLSCMLLQRSVDLFLDCAFNWAATGALQLMIAQQCDLELGDFVWAGGHVHICLNQLDQARVQLTLRPRFLPKLILNRRADSIDDYRIEDFSVEGYDPHPDTADDVAV